MKQYKRLTNNNRNEYDPEYDFCCSCKYFGEPNGCNRPNGTCDNYDRFLETYSRLAKLEDKIENGTLVELPCKVGDVAYTRYGGCINKWEVSEIDIFDFDILVKLENTGAMGWTTAYLSEVGDRLFFNKAEAEKRLEEIRNETKSIDNSDK